MTTAIEYLNLIDRKYLEAKKRRTSRFSIEWGQWSVVMNRVIIQTRMKDKGGADKEKLGYVFIYWSIMSRLLELHYKFKLLRNKEKKRLLQESKDIKEIIVTGKRPQPVSEERLKQELIKGLR